MTLGGRQVAGDDVGMFVKKSGIEDKVKNKES